MRLGLGMVLLCALVVAAAPTALADWPHPVKWEQLDPASGNYQWSTITDTDSQMVADDFMCEETGWITDIEFYCIGALANVDALRVTFWWDVPGTVDEESHPGELIGDPIIVNPAGADGIGFKVIEVPEPVGIEAKVKINLPECDWFVQEEGNIYWIGIQGYASMYAWIVRDPEGLDTNYDDAVYVDKQGVLWHLGYDEDGRFDKYQGRLPDDWTSADMCFRLTGIPIPEPSLIALLGVAGLALLKRRRR